MFYKTNNMTPENFATAQTLEAEIAVITSVQADNATTGAKVLVLVVDADNKTLADVASLKSALTENTYNTIAATALASINTALSTRKTALQGDFDDL